MNFEIATAGKSALNFIESYSEGETIGETVKVFENTVYLKTRNDDLICLTSKDVKAPMNLNLNTPVDFLKLDCISKKAIRTPTGLKLETVGFNTKNSKIYFSKKDSQMKDGLRDRVLFYLDEINLIDISGSIIDNHSPFFNELSYSIRSISESTQKYELKKLSEQLSCIVGLGNGFTPSGDDFIVGFLFCLNRILLCTNHKDAKFVIMGNTNWASKKFIDYSQNDIVIEPLEMFVNFLLSGENETKFPLMDLIQVGKSSGIDASIGAIIATVFVFDNDFRNLILTKLNFLK
ncbi:DUF2877 domain-containing protein [Marine Group I thaumarchaeote]|uniref:DUF2877 domain-containing protein n=1 Tax=Marine Group I thaumarchaeote TaxID=2511932 RepID=A0A7K4NFT7_9ARCH|nr:DUF2877 domain-containing protein [Marine Group I thaumarchaeote]